MKKEKAIKILGDMLGDKHIHISDETKISKEELKMRLDLLIPTNWLSDNFTFGMWDRDTQQNILKEVVELNPNWVKVVIESKEHKLSDILHDFKGIFSKDKHFLPRIS